MIWASGIALRVAQSIDEQRHEASKEARHITSNALTFPSPLKLSDVSLSIKSVKRSRTPDQNSGQEDQKPADHDLEEGRGERRVHEAVADPGDHAEFDDDDADGDRRGRAVFGDQVRQRVAEAAQGGHQAADEAAGQRAAAAGEHAVVGERFGEAHADPGAEARRQADEKCVVAVVRGEGRGEQRGERRDRAIHQAGQTRLDHLHHEQPLARGRFVIERAGLPLGAFQRLGQVNVLPLLLGQVAEQLADAGVGRLPDRRFVEPLRLEFHDLDLLADRRQAQRANQPDRPPLHEPLDVLPPDQRDVLAELLAVQFDQAMAMVVLLLAHLVEDLDGAGVVVAQARRQSRRKSGRPPLRAQWPGRGFPVR